MTANRRAATVLGVTALVCGSLGVRSVSAEADAVKLTGCLIRAEDGDGYLLTNSPGAPASLPSAEPRATAPSTMGTTGVVANIFYWLNKDDDLLPHVGHRVEIEGDLKGDLRDGEIKVDRKELWTEIEVESDGHDMKARVPNASVLPGPDPDRTILVLVRRVEVDHVRMLDAICR